MTGNETVVDCTVDEREARINAFIRKHLDSCWPKVWLPFDDSDDKCMAMAQHALAVYFGFQGGNSRKAKGKRQHIMSVECYRCEEITPQLRITFDDEAES